jgi:hypothetical protein
MVALVVLRNKAIKPLLAAAQGRRKSRGAQNPRPIDRWLGGDVLTILSNSFNVK